MAKLGAGVIGLGFGKAHVRGYLDHPDVDLRAVCDDDEARLRPAVEEHAVPFATTDWRALVARDDIDVVSIATPDHLHAAMAIAAMRAGKHVLCEKPMTTTVADALAVARAAEETGRKFMVGQVCRYAPGFVKAKEIVDSGEIGRLFFVESEYAHNYDQAAGHREWRKDPKRPRNAFLGGACHAVDLLRWVAGDALEVAAYANHLARPDYPVDDCYIAIFKFAHDVMGKVFCAIGCVRPYTMRSLFYGTQGTVQCDNRSATIQVCSRARCPDGEFKWDAVPVSISHHNVTSEIADFVDCIRGNKPVPTGAREGAKTVAMCLAAVEAAERQKAKRRMQKERNVASCASESEDGSKGRAADSLRPPYDIEERSVAYSLRLVKLYRSLRKTDVGRILGQQLLRAGTSVGANIHEARGGQSRADFVAKMAIAHKEVLETAYWLRLVKDANLVDGKRLEPLIDETSQLARIVATVVLKAKRKRGEQ